MSDIGEKFRIENQKQKTIACLIQCLLNFAQYAVSRNTVACSPRHAGGEEKVFS